MMSSVDITALLPHRKPFLFVDEIMEADEHGSISRYTFKPEESFFQGHFPDYPVVPGVILIEMMAQAGGAALKLQNTFHSDTLFFLATVNKVKFRSQVRPNDTVRMEIRNLRVSPQMIMQAGKAYIGTVLAAEAEWMCLAGTSAHIEGEVL